MPDRATRDLENPLAQWRGSIIQEWAKSSITGPTTSLSRSAVPAVKSLTEIPGGPYVPRITGKNSGFGHPALRERLAQLYETGSESVLVAQGASQANFLIAGALLEFGGTAIVETPVYEPVLRGIEFLADKVLRLPRRAENSYQPDAAELERLLTPETKLVWLTNLHNPTQIELDTDVLSRLIEKCERVGAVVVVDEVYLNFTRPDFRSHAYTRGAISVNSLDKTWGLDPLRVGWAIGPENIIDRAFKFNNLMGVNQPYITEDLADQILRSDKALAWFQLRRNTSCGQMQLLMSFLKSTPELKLLPPSGGVNACLKLPNGVDDRAFAAALQTEHGVMVFPCSLFELPGYIRVSLGCDPVETKLHLAKLGEAVRQFSSTTKK